MDDKARRALERSLSKIGDRRLKKADLEQMKTDVVKATGNKFLPVKTLKKWIKDVKKQMKSKKKKATPKKAPEPSLQVSDRVFLQTISYEIAGIRRMMDRISKQLDSVEEMLGK